MRQDRIAPLLADWDPVIRDAFLQAVRNLRSSVDLRALTALIKAGDVDGAARLLQVDPALVRPLDGAIEKTFEAGGIDATLAIKPVRGPLGIRITPVFDVRAPASVDWLRRHTTDLIQQISDDQRVMVREALTPLWSGSDPMLTGDTPQKIALDLVGRVSKFTGDREGGLIGLTSGQAQWARNYRIELGDVQANVPPSPNALTRVLRDKRYDGAVARAIRDGKPLPAETRDAMVAAYRNRALRYRAETIANHEALTALHESQIIAWEQAIARGAVAETGVRKYWITAGDERVRETHRMIPGMNEGGVGLRSAFATPNGPRMYPPIDPGCRCRVRVRVIE